MIVCNMDYAKSKKSFEGIGTFLNKNGPNSWPNQLKLLKTCISKGRCKCIQHFIQHFLLMLDENLNVG